MTDTTTKTKSSDKHMKRIWSVHQENTNKRWFFSSYDDTIASVKQSFSPERSFPTEQQTTDTTRLGFALGKADWIQINAIVLNSEPINLV